MKMVKPTLVVTLIFIGAAALGALSDILLAATYGAGRIMDALVTALFIPLLLQEYVLGDSFTQVFIPIFTGFLVRRQTEEGARVASTVINALMLFFAAVVLLVILAAPALVAMIVPGFDPASRDLTVTLTRIVMPVVLCTVLVSFMGRLLNAYQRFSLPSLVQVVYQLLLIVAIVTLGRWYGVTGLAVGVALTGLGQVLFLLPQVRAAGFGYRPVLELRHPAVRQMGILILPLLVRMVVAQSYFVAERMIASGLAVGSIAAMDYARKLYQFPTSTFAVALNTVLFPTMARQAAEAQWPELATTLVRGLRALLLIMAPISVLMVVLSRPMVGVLFQRGAFDGHAADVTAGVLSFLSLGLFALPAMWLVNLGFFALRDMTTPLWITVGLTLPAIGLNVLLAGSWGINGLAMGSTVLRTLQFLISLALLRGKLVRQGGQAGGLPLQPLLDAGLKVALGCVAMILMIQWVGPALLGVLAGHGAQWGALVAQVAYLAAMSGLAGVTYVVVIGALRTEEVGLLAGVLHRKGIRGAEKVYRTLTAPSVPSR